MLPAAAAAGVGIIARVPLASGLLSGKYKLDTTFAEDDHRNYNRDGSAFDVGETFSGVDYETGVAAAQEFSALVESSGLSDVTPAQVALAWVVQQPGVTTVIPGARNVDQASSQRGGRRAGSAAERAAGRDLGPVRRSHPRAGARALVARDHRWSTEPVRRGHELTDPTREGMIEGPGGCPPRPVALGGAGGVHPALVAKAEEVLGRHDAEAGG